MLSKLSKNKYKLLLLVGMILIIVDIFLHKGLVRFLLPKKFPTYSVENIEPLKNIALLNKNKNWVKAVNTPQKMEAITKETPGMELDIYFDTLKNIFDVHHDPGKSVGVNFENLLQIYKKKNLDASIWIDFKNAHQQNIQPALLLLVQLREKYKLQKKLLVESSNPALLQIFSENQFFTSYYVPFFNPYTSTSLKNKLMVDSMQTLLKKYPVHALSGYYFQMPFLHQYFPHFPILSWAPNDKWSLVNWVYKNKINANSSAFIALYN